ncbi:hypothetical protein U1Q18_041351 [Sarracenia purpurea var. burkii]
MTGVAMATRRLRTIIVTATIGIHLVMIAFLVIDTIDTWTGSFKMGGNDKGYVRGGGSRSGAYGSRGRSTTTEEVIGTGRDLTTVRGEGVRRLTNSIEVWLQLCFNSFLDVCVAPSILVL